MLIWVIEDDEAIAELIKATVSSAGYDVELFPTGELFFSREYPGCPDLILLDIMLPDYDGYQILQKIKGTPKMMDVPVIFLTAKGSELEKAKGLDLGADDYVTKPFGVLELLARIKSVLRRYKHNTVQTFRFKDLEINLTSKEIEKDGVAVRLTYKEFELFQLLFANKGVVFSRDQLLEKVWGYDFAGDTTRTVDMHVNSLRKKLGDNKENPQYIITVRGYGYKFARE